MPAIRYRIYPKDGKFLLWERKGPVDGLRLVGTYPTRKQAAMVRDNLRAQHKRKAK